MIQPRPWGKSPFVYHSLFTAKFPEGKSHYTTLFVLVSHLIYTELQRPAETRSLQLCYRIKETKLLDQVCCFPPTPLSQTCWCPLSTFLCSAQTLRDAPQQEIQLHNSGQDICSGLCSGTSAAVVVSCSRTICCFWETPLSSCLWFQHFEKSFLFSMTSCYE